MQIGKNRQIKTELKRAAKISDHIWTYVQIVIKSPEEGILQNAAENTIAIGREVSKLICCGVLSESQLF